MIGILFQSEKMGPLPPAGGTLRNLRTSLHIISAQFAQIFAQPQREGPFPSFSRLARRWQNFLQSTAHDARTEGDAK